MKIESITLHGKVVELRTMKPEHIEALFAASDESLWQWTMNVIENLDDMKHYVETALDEFDRGVSLPFVTIDRSSDKIVGSTRFGNIDLHNRKVEIGWTWINTNWQRTAINTEAKLLMLTQAFEKWKCVRVEFKTDALNERSRNAIKRIGAIEEGILRRHMITEAGRFRDSVYFSIIDNEWETVKQNLTKKLRSSQ